MSDREALFRAILDAPDDDAPRLIFADFLEENGDELRAEYIRLQCKMDRAPANTSARRPAEIRCAELERAWLKTWNAPFEPLVMSMQCRRGFVDAVHLTIESFIKHAEKLQQMSPVRLWGFQAGNLLQPGPAFAEAITAPAFANVRDISIGSFSSLQLVEEIITSPKRTGLRGVTINDDRIAVWEWQRFFAALPQLQEISAHKCDLRGLACLWRKGAVQRLRRLELSYSRVTNQVLEGIANSAALGKLEVLWLDNNPFDERGLEALLESEYLQNLQELSLANVSLGNQGAFLLARAPSLKKIRLLNLAGCGIDAGGAQAFADSPYFQELELLCLDRNRVSIGVEHELVNRFGREAVFIGW